MKFAAVLTLSGVLFSSIALGSELPKPLTSDEFRSYPEAQVKLGQLLFYDRILSGSYRVSCATCHNHDRGSSNGFLLPDKNAPKNDALATNGIDPYDATRPSSRHAPHLFNLGAKQVQALFSDGRVARKEDSGFFVPINSDLPAGLKDVLAVQSLFPAVTGDELTGTVDSDLKAVFHLGNKAIWDALAKRIQDLPEYWPHFHSAYPKLKSHSDIDITSIANALGAFVGTEWRSTNSPFDRFLAGERDALGEPQKRGMELFFGEAGCSQCHSGALMSDGDYHAIGAWPWRFDADFSKDLPEILKGRVSVTEKVEDAFKMRTPSLRNLNYSAPYGWAGGYETLKGIVQAHVQPNLAYLKKLKQVKQSGSPWPDTTRSQFREVLQARSMVTPAYFRSSNTEQTERAIDDLVAFLKSLDDEKGVRGRLGKPKEVPSSLALD